MSVARDSCGGLPDGAAKNLLGRLAPVLERLAGHVESVVDQQAETLRKRSPSSLPGHDRVPDDALLPSVFRDVDRSARTLRYGRSPRPEHADGAKRGYPFELVAIPPASLRRDRGAEPRGSQSTDRALVGVGVQRAHTGNSGTSVVKVSCATRGWRAPVVGISPSQSLPSCRTIEIQQSASMKEG